MKDGNFVCVVATKRGERKEKRRRNSFVVKEKIIRIILTNQWFCDTQFLDFHPKISFLSFPFILIDRDHPRIIYGALWEGPGDLSSSYWV
jgi:hypothetical protein